MSADSRGKMLTKSKDKKLHTHPLGGLRRNRLAKDVLKGEKGKGGVHHHLRKRGAITPKGAGGNRG